MWRDRKDHRAGRRRRLTRIKPAEASIRKRLVLKVGQNIVYAMAMIFAGGVLVGAVLVKSLLIEDPQIFELLPSSSESATSVE